MTTPIHPLSGFAGRKGLFFFQDGGGKGGGSVSLHLIDFHGSLQVLERGAVAVRVHQGGVLLALGQRAGLGAGEALRGARGRVAAVEVGGCCDAWWEDAR